MVPGWPIPEDILSEYLVWETVVMPGDAEGYSARLYAVLHALDGLGLDRIVVDLPPMSDAWLAVHDRLRRAAPRLRVSDS